METFDNKQITSGNKMSPVSILTNTDQRKGESRSKSELSAWKEEKLEIKRTQEQMRQERIKKALANSPVTLPNSPSGKMNHSSRAASLASVLAKELSNKSSNSNEETLATTNFQKTEDILSDTIKEGLGDLSVTTLASILEDNEPYTDDNGKVHSNDQIRFSVAKYVLDRILGKPAQKEEVRIEKTVRRININFKPPEAADMKAAGVLWDETIAI